jgi:hypothetical protein
MRHTFFFDLYAYFFQEEALQIVYVDYDEGHARHSGGDFLEKFYQKSNELRQHTDQYVTEVRPSEIETRTT